MTYNRVTSEERRLIYQWKQEGFSLRKIGLLLDRAPSSISREIKRNSGQRGYRPAQAQAGVIRARLARNLASSTGREDYVAVRLEQRDGEWWAVPVLGKSNLVFTLVHADGTLTIPLNSNGVKQGEFVEISC